MDDLISRQAAIDAINETIARYIPYLTRETNGILLEVALAIKRLPSAEVEPVKRGRWIVEHGVIYGHGENSHYGDLWHCSECGRRELDVEGWDYCPTCGAKLEGAEE